MLRLSPAFLLLLVLTGCFSEPAASNSGPSSTPPAEAAAASPARTNWPVKQASHVAGERGAKDALKSALDDEQTFALQLGKLAATAGQLESVQDYESAQEARREIVEKLERRYGAKAWQAVSGRLALAHTERLPELTFEQRGKLIEIGEAERWSATLAAQGQTREALSEAARAVELTREVWGDDYYLTANRWFDKAQIHHALGEHKEAAALYHKTLAYRRKALGREHPDYVAVLGALSVHYQTLSQFEKAEKALLEAVDLDKTIWGERHPTYATQLNNLGMLYHALGKHEEASQWLRPSADIRREALGGSHPLYAHSLYNLGSNHYAAGEHDQALAHFDEALPILERELGPTHPMTLLAKNNLAMVELALENPDRAQTLLSDVLDGVGQQSGKESASYASALVQLAVAYSHQSQFARAETLLAQAQAIQEQTLGVDDPQVGKTLEIRVAVLRRDKRDAEAARLEARAKRLAPAAAP